jgi:hypothetical protein
MNTDKTDPQITQITQITPGRKEAQRSEIFGFGVFFVVPLRVICVICGQPPTAESGHDTHPTPGRP